MSIVTLKDWRDYPVGREKYQLYLASREWAVLKEAVKARSGGTCERCHAAPGQSVHHQTYERVYVERLDDLVHTCEPCHAFVSGKRDEDPKMDPVPTFSGRPIRSVYLAGKIARNSWRDEIVPGWSDQNHGIASEEVLHSGAWEVTSGCVPVPGCRPLDLAGPYWRIREDLLGHSSIGGSACTHSWGDLTDLFNDEARGFMSQIYAAIRSADLFFAWIDSHLCFGTLAEIGFARGCGKPIVVSYVSGFDWEELWLSLEMADVRIHEPSLGEAWKCFWSEPSVR